MYIRLSITSYLHKKSHPVRYPFTGSSGGHLCFPLINLQGIFPNVRHVTYSAWSDTLKEPVKSEYLCKNELELTSSMTTGP